MADPITPEQLDEIAARADAATPGPWETTNHRSIPSNAFDDEWGVYPPLGESGPVALASGSEFDNGPFIAAARTDVPALVAEVRRLQEIEKATDAFVNKALGFHSAHWWRLQGDLIDLGAMLPSWSPPEEVE